MADVTGPISSMPGTSHEPKGSCDNHPDREATVRIQGETDSFGCEMHDLCSECAAQWREEARTADTSGKCDWCKSFAPRRRETRDYEEGLNGPVYLVCEPCRKRRDDEAERQLDSYWD